MKIKERIPGIIVVGVLALGLGVIASKFTGGSSPATRIAVTVPELSAGARQGKAAFDANCAECHGANAGGGDKGPPLVHPIYNPGHHADGAFFRAVRRGVRGHHWSFGNMPAQPQLNQGDIAGIIAYVREMQQANGIFYKPHNM